ncbi:MAG: RNA polymerase sigma factor [Lachnospiraceae bacterium]|nr:RNA polymerase sigma factor [Lachnospiraceae bacterium]
MDNLETLFEKHYSDVFRYLRGLTGSEDLAEELTQETFYRALRALKDFRGDCPPRVWLCQIAKNLYYEHLRKQKKTVSLEEEESLPELPDSGVPFETMLEDRDTAQALHRALHGLRDPYKEVFSLRVFGELSFRDIADLFGKTEHWACVTYHRAKAMIREGIA